MYIEIIHDAIGQIKHCWCADTLPKDNDSPLFSLSSGIPAGHKQVRINIDTLTAMEINTNATRGGGARYIKDNFTIDITKDIPTPPNITLPVGMEMRELRKKP